MTSRERFRAALNHQEGDRIPIDVGQDFHNGIHEVAYRNLLAHLGQSDEIRIYDQMQHLAVVKEDILNRLHADTRYVFAGAADGFELKIEDDTSWLDEWGVKRKTCGYYDENMAPPLKELTAEKLKRYQMPDPRDPARFKGLRTKAKALTRDTEYALVCGNACSLFFLSSELTGFQEYMEKLLAEPDLIALLVDSVFQWQMAYFDKLLDEVGDLTEIVWMGDDWGTQLGPIMNPKIFKELFIPRYKEFTSFVKRKTDAKIALHSCGSILWAMEDLIEAGIEVLHPIQGDAREMKDPGEIKKRFGDRLVFYSNLRNQSVIPYGTPEQVRDDVLLKVKHLAPGGGFIISGGHNIQADVPPENVLALFDTAFEKGEYPITI